MKDAISRTYLQDGRRAAAHAGALLSPFHPFTYSPSSIDALKVAEWLQRSKEATFYSDRVKKATQVEFILIILLGVFTNKHMQEVTMTLSGH